MGYIAIKKDRCKSCGLCVNSCPRGLIALKGEELNAIGYKPAGADDPEHKCTACKICAEMCPDMAIEVYK